MVKRCASCARGEVEFTEEDGKLIKVIVRDPNTKKIEISGYLCDDHLEMYLSVGYEIKEVKYGNS